MKKVIEIFPAASKVTGSMYDNSYHFGNYFYDCDTTSSNNLPDEEKEKIRQDWEDNPQWLAYFPYVIGDKIHVVATSRYHIWHYIYKLSDYSRISKTVTETDAALQNYSVGFNYVQISSSSPRYRWFYGCTANNDNSSVLSAFEWDDNYFAITKNPVIDGKTADSTNNYGQFGIFSKSGKSSSKILQYIANGSLSGQTTASWWGFYVDEKTGTPLLTCYSYSASYSVVAVEIIKKGDNYGWYRMRISAPTPSGIYVYNYANLMKVDGVTLPQRFLQ